MGSSPAPCTPIIRIFLVSVAVASCISYAPRVYSSCCCYQLLYYRQSIGIRLSKPVLHIMTFVFPAFTLNPFFSMVSFNIKSLLTHYSRESAMMTRSSAYTLNQSYKWPLFYFIFLIKVVTYNFGSV